MITRALSLNISHDDILFAIGVDERGNLHGSFITTSHFDILFPFGVNLAFRSLSGLSNALNSTARSDGAASGSHLFVIDNTATLLRSSTITFRYGADWSDGLDGFAFHLSTRELRASSGILDITGDRDASSSESRALRLSTDLRVSGVGTVLFTAGELKAASGILDIAGDVDASSSRSRAPRLSADSGLGGFAIHLTAGEP